MRKQCIRSAAIGLCVLAAMVGGMAEAHAQTTLDHVDPAKVEATLPVAPAVVPSLPVTVQPAAPVSIGSAPVTVGAIMLSGLRTLHPADFADIYATYVGRTLSPIALAGLADAIADRARERGFLFVAVTIPPQTLEAGLLKLTIDEGRVDEVRLVGVDNHALRATLAPIVGVGPVTADQVQLRLLLAGDIPGMSLRQTRLVREGDRDILVVELGDKRISGVVTADNFGSRPIGPIRLTASATVARLLADDDAVTYVVATSPFHPRELGYGAVRYAKRVGSNGTELSGAFSYAAVHPGSYLTDRDIDGRSWTAQLSGSRPLLRRTGGSLWLQASFDVRSVKQDWAGELARRDRLSVGRLRLYGYATVLGGVIQASATASQGVDLFDANRAGDPLASRADADGKFTSVAFTADWSGPVIGRLGARVSLAGQVAGEPLLISEELGLGGGQFLRPYDYDERSGDDGVAGSTELHYLLARSAGPLKGPSIYAFASGGSVGNLRDGYGGGSLFTTGGGLRSSLGRTVTADAGIAFPLSGARYDSGNRQPVVNLQLTKRF
ncbi:ShlB/FhaC/HecB family hemolysin secretion/activation protein [Sphingomonas bacterium]|uniref:ShlB/FhaC/HecB family hemolysin secretion/activation protein n=1 Tax=Sphingomonas bacterium TaxID=1895847 RepID=UPI001574EE7B|nr:ShlB/FhaC/HecB family hemolysin secretion/activation protein [Sphingomonas bacterium]